MKRLYAIAAALAVGTGFSQAGAANYFGVRLGFPELGVQLGSTNLFGRNFGGRVTADFEYFNASALLVSGDLLYAIPLQTSGNLGLDVYLGGGVGLGFGFGANNAPAYNAHAVLGLDVTPTSNLSFFIETRPYLFGSTGFALGGAIGANFRI